MNSVRQLRMHLFQNAAAKYYQLVHIECTYVIRHVEPT